MLKTKVTDADNLPGDGRFRSNALRASIFHFADLSADNLEAE